MARTPKPVRKFGRAYFRNSNGTNGRRTAAAARGVSCRMGTEPRLHAEMGFIIDRGQPFHSMVKQLGGKVMTLIPDAEPMTMNPGPEAMAAIFKLNHE